MCTGGSSLPMADAAVEASAGAVGCRPPPRGLSSRRVVQVMGNGEPRPPDARATGADRGVNITDPGKENLLDFLPPDRFTILPNTAGCYSAEEAIRTCRLAREAGVGTLVKLEVIGDERTLFPDVAATIEAAKSLVKEGFQVLPYVTDDPVACKRLEELGCAAVMPLAAPIGSGLGVRNPFNLRTIVEQSRVPVIVDAGVGTASHAAEALELGGDAVLMNTAIAGAKDARLT